MKNFFFILVFALSLSAGSITNIKGLPSDVLEGNRFDGRSISVANNYTKDIATGKIKGSEPFGAYGRKVTTGAEDTNLLWANGAWYIPVITGEQIRVVSTSASDGIGGIGIRSVHMHYLDSDLIDRDEEVDLNGTTAVFSIAQDVRFIQCGHLDTFGSSKKAVGQISFTNLDANKTFNQIDIGEARCSSSARMVPKGKRAVVVGLVASSVSGTAAASSIVNLAVTYFANHDYTLDTVLIPIGSIGVQDNGVTFNLPIPYIAPEGSIVAMTASTDKAATITGDWYGWIEDDN